MHRNNKGKNNYPENFHQEMGRLRADNQQLQLNLQNLHQYAETATSNNQYLYQAVEKLTAEKEALEESSKKLAIDQAILQDEYKSLSLEKESWQKKAMDGEKYRWNYERSEEALQSTQIYAAQLETANQALQQETWRLERENSTLMSNMNTMRWQDGGNYLQSAAGGMMPFSSEAFGGMARLSSMSPSSFYPLSHQNFSQKSEPPVSSVIHSKKIRQRTFEEEVFRLPSRGITTEAQLNSLRTHLQRGEETSEYFEQFIAYILEEVRASIAARIKVINQKHLRPFAANFSHLPRQQDIPKDWQYVNVSCSTIELPELDHGFYNEAVHIELPGKKDGRKRVSKDNFDGLLAIASVNNHYDEESEDGDERRRILTLKIPKKDYFDNRAFWEANPEINIHWLHGLIPSSRAYQVCVDMPKVAFESQFIYGQLEQWPSMSADLREDMLSRLNSSQRHVTESLIQVSSGLYLVQGPPGTGKTKSVAELATQRATVYPADRILLCTPTHQSLHVALNAIRMIAPNLPLALIGISKNLSEEMAEVFVHGFARRLYQPFEELKKTLTETSTLRLPALLLKIRDQHTAVIHKLETLLSAPDQRPVEPIFLETIQELFEKMRSPGLVAAIGEKNREALTQELKEIICILKENAHMLESFLVQRAAIVFSTLISSGREWLKKQVGHFATLIIDEAAQAPIPETLIPLRFNPKLCIHVGDPNQLPATVISKVAQEGGYGNSLMYCLMKVLGQPFQMLTWQYRMHPQIAHWPSKQFYDGKVETAPMILERKSPFEDNALLAPVFKQPSVFFNIQGAEERRGANNSASIYNNQEAIAVVKTVHYLLECGLQAHQIGVITFYSAQVERIMHYLHTIIGYNEATRRIKVSTVDAFQGGERDAVMLSMVRTGKSVGFIGGESGEQRVNVAMTRARHFRGLFGNAETLSQSNSDMPNFLRDDSTTVIEENELTSIIGSFGCR